MLSFTLSMLFLSLPTLSHSYPRFQAQIPNGASVPNPCQPGATWPGVGHKAEGGGGPRNPFGLAFFANGKVWTAALCQQDSDGDGKTNGQELGDPDCTWTVGSQPKLTIGLSHPGICEPVSSPACQRKNDWLLCSPPFSCPAFELDTTKKINLTFPATPVPAQETTYMCLGFKLPSDTSYHIIGMTPITKNAQVVHHAVLLGCDDDVILSENELSTPKECGLVPPNCFQMIGTWAPGYGGICNADEFGFLMGPRGFQYAVLQIHYTNPTKASNLVDSSGMTLYYTSHLRPNDGMVLQAGQFDVTIPPRKESVTITGTCTSECSSQMQPKTLHIAGALLHMHLLGKSGDIQLIRSGEVPQVLVNVPSYNYNGQKFTYYEHAIDYRAGDEIKVTCNYQSLNKNTTTYWGEATTDEMCNGLIIVYPVVKGLRVCVQYNQLDICRLPTDLNVLGCNIMSLIYTAGVAGHVCDVICSSLCHSLFNNMRSTGCLDGDVEGLLRYVQDPAGLGKLLHLKDICDGLFATKQVGQSDGQATVRPPAVPGPRPRWSWLPSLDLKLNLKIGK